jgi:ATP-dependent Lon protease
MLSRNCMVTEFKTTADVQVPKTAIEKVIGQEEAVRIARIAAAQKRHVLLVGAPGTGKSMLAQSVASLLTPPTKEISVLHNNERPERPILSVRVKEQMDLERKSGNPMGMIIDPSQAPIFVSEKLGYRCRRCAEMSSPTLPVCPSCGADKGARLLPFDLPGMEREKAEPRVPVSRMRQDGKEEIFIYERMPDGNIRVMSQMDFQRSRNVQKRKVIVPLQRQNFVQASGASETEMLGDVKHDPYGGHPEIGTPPYLRVVAGAIHDSHEGVLFVDELSTLGGIQRYILTAMQEKSFPIVGRNPTSTGAIVRVDNVPCDFILVGAVNINELPSLMPALRSRIRGEGYEVLMKSTMEDTAENRARLAQFVAQEIIKDGKIPHADYEAFEEIMKEARRWAKDIDGKTGLTLRLRGLGGIIKLAGDFSVTNKCDLIGKEHVKEALLHSKSIEEQIEGAYPNWWKAKMADYGMKSVGGGGESV